MNFLKKISSKIKLIKKNRKIYINDMKCIVEQSNYAMTERAKPIKRTDIINFLLSLTKGEKIYLEIGVRDRKSNFDLIKSNRKYSVDPAVKLPNNNHFQITSDDFFKNIKSNKILSNNIKFDVIFVDGLHLAEQVEKDIKSSLQFIKDDGFIVLHDCNPPSEWHARETYSYYSSPAKDAWNGTVWKAFLNIRFNSSLQSCCIDTDWGVGIISTKYLIGSSISNNNKFFEFETFKKDKKRNLNLISFEEFKNLFK
tara:strand:+ start:619 stop:1380 length:762 start_codon:yes stop_codon:yes gene_type:complete